MKKRKELLKKKGYGQRAMSKNATATTRQEK
jgi:hypothetical protein